MATDGLPAPDASEPDRTDILEAVDDTTEPDRRDAAETEGGRRSPGAWIREEALLALELGGLVSLAVARPVLDSFGRSPETFVARGVTAPLAVVAFGLVVLLTPAAAVVVAGLATSLLGRDRRRLAHGVLVALVAGLAAWRYGADVAGWPTSGRVAAGLVVGVAVGAARWRRPGARTFLRIAGAASVVFLVQFVALSPTSDLVFGVSGGGDRAEMAASVSATLPDHPPDVVMVVFDGLPLATLLDGGGRIDSELYPNFAELAATSSWYRNDTTVSLFTRDALPALLTGRYPDGGPDGAVTPGSANLFTLLSGAYDLHVAEQITRLCPDDLCPRGDSAGLGPLLGDAVALWRDGTAPAGSEGPPSLPAVLDDDRYPEAERWIAGSDFTRGDRPKLHFGHIVLPHDPWQVTDEGETYASERFPTGFQRIGWSEAGLAVGRQRHVLQTQAADRLLGQLLDRLRAAGTFDDTLVVVTSDHGHAFVPGDAWRWLSTHNYDQLMWTPLLVKAPGQTRGRISDDNVMSIDVVPTIADILGVDLPDPVDGVPADRAGRRPRGAKYVDDDTDNIWRPGTGRPVVEVDGDEGFARVLAADPVPADGPGSVWRRTAHGDLVGRAVAELDVAGRAVGTVDVAGLDVLAAVDTSDPLPIEVVGRADLEAGTVVAYALNGTVGAVTDVEADDRVGTPLVHGLVPPELFVDGRNDLRAYVVDGPPGAETLRPLEVGAGS
jgi:hypothetical protein